MLHHLRDRPALRPRLKFHCGLGQSLVASSTPFFVDSKYFMALSLSAWPAALNRLAPDRARHGQRYHPCCTA